MACDNGNNSDNAMFGSMETMKWPGRFVISGLDAPALVN
jgi:hypothetical protein